MPLKHIEKKGLPVSMNAVCEELNAVLIGMSDKKQTK